MRFSCLDGFSRATDPKARIGDHDAQISAPTMSRRTIEPPAFYDLFANACGIALTLCLSISVIEQRH